MIWCATLTVWLRDHFTSTETPMTLNTIATAVLVDRLVAARAALAVSIAQGGYNPGLFTEVDNLKRELAHRERCGIA